MNTLDSLLPQLRSLLPASLRGEYLDGYLQRERTRMELLLSRSMPNVNVEASTFEDVRSEIRALGMPQWVANRYLAEAEQALAVGQDTREVVARAKAWMANRIADTTSPSADDRRYHVVVINERTGEKQIVSRPEEPLTHAEGVTFLSKMSDYPWRRKQLEEVETTKLVEAEEQCHVCSETGQKSCTACGTEIVPYGAHGLVCPKCAEQDLSATNAYVRDDKTTWILRNLRGVEGALSPEHLHEDGEASPAKVRKKLKALTAERASLVKQLGREPTEEELNEPDPMFRDIKPRFHEDVLGSEHLLRIDGPQRVRLWKWPEKTWIDAYVEPLTLGEQWHVKLRHTVDLGGSDPLHAIARTHGGRYDSLFDEPEYRFLNEKAARMFVADVLQFEASGSSRTSSRPVTEIDRLNAESAAKDLRAARIDEDRNADKRLPKMLRLQKMAASPPSDLSGWSQRITDLYDIRMRPVKKIFGSRGPTPAQQSEYDAEKKLWESLNRKAKAEHKRLLAASNAGLPPPPARPSRRTSLPDPVLTRSSGSAYRSEADMLADIFNEDGTWQAEATAPVGKSYASGVRLLIFPEHLGPSQAVARATIDGNEVDVEWLSSTLTLVQRSELTRRLRTAALTHGEDSEAPSPLHDLIESTEKRALELGAKPARTRRLGDLLGDREARTGPVDLLERDLRDLQDPTEIAESIKWLEDQDLGIDFDIDERLSETDSVSSLMEEIWTPILDTIGMEGVSTQNMRGGDRILSVATGAVFRGGAPFLLQRLVQQGRPTVRKVWIEIVKDSSDDDVTAFIDRDKIMTVGREQGSIGPIVHSSEQRGEDFIYLLYQHMDRLREDLERAPKVLGDVRRLLYWTAAMLGAPRCQDDTKKRAMESFEAAMSLYDKARKLVTTQSTTASDLASIKAPLRKAAVSAAKLATDCGEGQVDIFSVRQPPAPLRIPSPDEMPSRWMSGDHVVGPNGENGTIVRLEDRGEYGWHLKLDRPPGAHWQSAAGFRRVPESGRHEPPPVAREGAETPLHQQDPGSVDVLDRLVAALSEVFIVTPIRSGHGYRVVDLRSSVDFGVYKGLPRNTYLTTVSLRHSGPSEIIGDKAYLFQSTRDAGLSQDQFRAIRRFVAETVERLTDEAQGNAPPEPEVAEDSEVTTKTFAPRMPTKYLRDFFAEKDIPEVHWKIVDSSGVEHMRPAVESHRHDLLTEEGQPSSVAEQVAPVDTMSPHVVTWSDLRKGDLVWDPKSDDYDLLLVTRRGATSHWWTTSGIMQKTGGTTIAVDGTAQHSWSYSPADPDHVLILVGRGVKPYSANVRAAWDSAKDAAQQLAEFY
jgi:hypothetical protein